MVVKFPWYFVVCDILLATYTHENFSLKKFSPRNVVTVKIFVFKVCLNMDSSHHTWTPAIVDSSQNVESSRYKGLPMVFS